MWRLQLRTLSFRCKIASNLYWYHCIQASFMQSVPSLLCWCRSPFTIFKFSLDSCLKLEGPVFSLGTGSIPFLVTCTFFSFSYFLVFYFFVSFSFFFHFFFHFLFYSFLKYFYFYFYSNLLHIFTELQVREYTIQYFTSALSFFRFCIVIDMGPEPEKGVVVGFPYPGFWDLGRSY